MPGKNSLFGEIHIGRWVRLRLIGGFEVVARIVAVGHQRIEVAERGGEDTWHVPDKSIAAYSWVACPADQPVPA